MKDWHYIVCCICNWFVVIGAVLCAILVITGPAPTKLSYCLMCTVVVMQGAERIAVNMRERKRGGKA